MEFISVMAAKNGRIELKLTTSNIEPISINIKNEEK